MGLRKCITCGRVICELRASFYKPPLSDMCNYHRTEEIKKMAEEDASCIGEKH